MFTRYCRRPGPPFCRSRTRRKQCGRNTYAACLQASRCNGVTVQAPPPRARSGTGLLRYKRQWERKEAEVFAKRQALTGIPVFAAPDTLRVISGECSFVVPLKEVVGIRVADGMNNR